MADKRKRRLFDAMGEPTTIIDRSTEIHGEIHSNGHVLVMGAVFGDSDMEGSITLAEGASWTGRMRGADLIIAGSVDGDVTARDRVEIRPGARIQGSVSASRIAIGEGAVVDGDLRTSGSGEPTRFVEKRNPGGRASRE